MVEPEVVQPWVLAAGRLLLSPRPGWMSDEGAVEGVGRFRMGLLSGCSLLHDVGYLESGMTASCESIIFGNEVVEYARRLFQNVDVTQETLAVQTIKRVGPGGTFLDAPHTVSHLRDFWYSRLIDRRRYSQWVNDGCQTMYDRLRARTEELLSSHEPTPLDRSLAKSMSSLIAARDDSIRLHQVHD